jgi:hypothetical protein
VELRRKDQGLQASGREDCFGSLRSPGWIECPALEHQSKGVLVAEDSQGRDAKLGELVRRLYGQNIGSMS